MSWAGSRVGSRADAYSHKPAFAHSRGRYLGSKAREGEAMPAERRALGMSQASRQLVCGA